MLTHLHIRHFAIIDSSELEFDVGMTALTGETGAGKSILLDALGLVLGARASVDSVQQDAARADITASFNLDRLPTVARWLSEHELDSDDECLIRRSISATGKSRASINDVPVSVQTLKELGEQLVAIHGQHAYQRMGKVAEQRALLDGYAGSKPGGKQYERVASAFDAWQSVSKAYDNLAQDAVARAQRSDLLSFQLQEFDELDIGSLSVDQIESEHRWLASADRILALGKEVMLALDDTASPALGSAIGPLTELVQIDEKLRESLDLIESANIQANEAANLVRRAISDLEHDDARLAWLDQKLGALHRLARKHQCQMSELSSVEQALREEFDSLNDPATGADELCRQRDALRSVYDTEAGKLTRHRRKHAKALARQISDAMQGLNMEGGVFEINVDDVNAQPSMQGNDTVRFLVSPNPGVAPGELARIASGGELSRISLCIQLATIGSHTVSTLVFDEVDAGIGGAVAQTVGELLRQVGSQSQVLCVTHLPQVAAQAHQHLLIDKKVVKGKTRTSVRALDEKATRDEIARMLGGAKITNKTRQHAQEMLDSAASMS